MQPARSAASFYRERLLNAVAALSGDPQGRGVGASGMEERGERQGDWAAIHAGWRGSHRAEGLEALLKKLVGLQVDGICNLVGACHDEGEDHQGRDQATEHPARAPTGISKMQPEFF